MTPDEVKHASGGRALAIGDLAANGTPGHEANLMMPYEAAGADFTAYFQFDVQDRLIAVQLVGADGVTNMIPVLTSKYGAPISDDDTDGLMRIAKWQTRDDEILALELIGIGNVPAHTTITHRARISSDTKGL